MPCPPTGDLPHPGIEPAPLTSPALTGRFLYHGRHLGSTSSSHMALKSIHTVGDSHSYTSNLDPPLSSRLGYPMASPHHLWISSTHLKASLPQAEPRITLPFPKRAPARPLLSIDASPFSDSGQNAGVTLTPLLLSQPTCASSANPSGLTISRIQLPLPPSTVPALPLSVLITHLRVSQPLSPFAQILRCLPVPFRLSVIKLKVKVKK